jgi:hypothetical protein
MAKVSLAVGTTSYLARVFIQDSSSVTGAGLTGLAFNTASLVCYRARDDDGNAAGTAITLATATRGTWTSGGFVEKDSANMPGIYEFGIPNAALATGSKTVDIIFKGAANMAPLVLEIELTAVNNQDAVRFGMTALPNVSSGAAGAIITAGTGTAQLSVAAGLASANATQFAGQTITAAAGVTLPSSVASPTNITAGTITTATNVTTVNGLAANVITATSIASNALTAAKIATDAIGAAQLAADAVTEIQSGLATSTAQTTTNNRLGSITGTGANTVLGFFQSLARSDVTASTDLAGTFDSSTDALQALKDDQMTAGDLQTAILTSALTESYAADGSAPTLAQICFQIWSFLSEKSVSSTTLTAHKIDGSTSAMTFTLDSATNPTSITRAS